MSAAEIIAVIKAINDHVTVKYCRQIIDYLAEKKKAHLLFEREFFNEMDKAMQQLINNISRSFHVTSQEIEPFQKIQTQCIQYNKWKKNKYDDHLSKIEQLEKGLDQFIRKKFSEKLLDQDTLFDEALSEPLKQNNSSQDNTEEKQNKPHIVNNNLYQTAGSNLFNDNVTHSTIFSNSSPNTIVHQTSDEEKIHQNEVMQTLNNINNITTLNLTQFPPIKINTQNTSNNKHNKHNNEAPLPISFSTKKHKSKNNDNGSYGLNRNTNINTKRQNLEWSSNKSVHNQTNITHHIPPPKPPPPTSIDCSDSELSDISNNSSVDTTIKKTKQYQCQFCGQEFSARLRWESHLLTHQCSNRIKAKVVSKSRPKRKKKRNFHKMNIDRNKLDVSNEANKKSCHRYQCEYCDKQYVRQTAYIKHYNNHMFTNKNIECNFCENKFNIKQDLKQHINQFGAGIAVDDGFYQCCQCTMRFERKNELTSHINFQHQRYPTGEEERNKSVEFI